VAVKLSRGLVRAWLPTGARWTLVAGPTALAFFAGGFFSGPRAWAGLVAWLLVAVAALTQPRITLHSRATWVAVGGVSLLAVLTLCSVAWAPIAGNAYGQGQLVVLYAGVMIAAVLLLRSSAELDFVEPVLALGAVVVIGYGLSGRLLPGVLHFARSVSARGRLEQPLTYWNAMGELAAIGLVLCARLAGDRRRARWIRSTAAACSAPLGMGLYLSFSRGALFACGAGLVALVIAAPTREQLRSVLLAVVAGGLAALAAAPHRGVTALAGALGDRERQGAIALAFLLGIAAVAGTAQYLLGAKRGSALRLPRRAGWIGLLIICAGLALAIVVGAKEGTGNPSTTGAGRLVSLETNRYAYWRVAVRAFGAQPLRGVGAGGWSVWWLRYRRVNDFAQDAHSLPLQTAAELGVVGLLFLGMLVGGVAFAARRAHRVVPEISAGAIAVIVVYAAHAPLDWDWQMPAVTLPALILAGRLLALADAARPADATRQPRAAQPGEESLLT
jgi:hypothetical protein